MLPRIFTELVQLTKRNQSTKLTALCCFSTIDHTKFHFLSATLFGEGLCIDCYSLMPILAQVSKVTFPYLPFSRVSAARCEVAWLVSYDSVLGPSLFYVGQNISVITKKYKKILAATHIGFNSKCKQINNVFEIATFEGCVELARNLIDLTVSNKTETPVSGHCQLVLTFLI